MRTAEEIVLYIDRLEQHMLKRQGIYAGSPESLEEQMQLLETLRAFILGHPSDGTRGSPYWEYAQREAKVGPLNFTGKCRNEMWSKFTEFFKGYLVSQGRNVNKGSLKRQIRTK